MAFMLNFDDIKPGARLRGLDASGIAEIVSVSKFCAEARIEVTARRRPNSFGVGWCHRDKLGDATGLQTASIVRPLGGNATGVELGSPQECHVLLATR